MNKRLAVIFVAALVCAALLASLATDSLANPAANQLPSTNIVQSGVLTGGEYKLSTGIWHIGGTLSGPGYHLEVSTSVEGTGTPCCCNKLPCINKK